MTSVENTKTCPYCAEAIQANALKCRYCHSFLGAKLPAEEPANQVTYVVDRGLIQFAKFTIGILAIFSVVGVFFFGLELKTIRKEVTTDRKTVEQALDVVEDLKERTVTAATAAATYANSTKALLDSASKELGAIETTHIKLKTRIRQLNSDEKTVLKLRIAEDPGAFERKDLWPIGHTLRVKFLEGTAEQIELVKREAKKWQAVANLNFNFIESGKSDIRIKFQEFEGNWSYVGRQSLAIGDDNATINLGTIGYDLGGVLHEFGHILGFLHEHQNPQRTFEWNEEVVLNELAPNAWSQSQIEQNVLGTWAEDSLPFTKEYDENSIMHFEFAAAMFKDNRARGGKNVLSEKDKAFAAKLYPRN